MRRCRRKAPKPPGYQRSDAERSFGDELINPPHNAEDLCDARAPKLRDTFIRVTEAPTSLA
jgi:hypothetical protein